MSKLWQVDDPLGLEMQKAIKVKDKKRKKEIRLGQRTPTVEMDQPISQEIHRRGDFELNRIYCGDCDEGGILNYDTLT